VFERFTERARAVVILAQEASQELGHNRIGTEHLLVGLLAERDGLGAWTLIAGGMTLDSTFAAAGRLAPPDQEPTAGLRPFTTQAKQAIESANVQVGRRRLNFIGTEHLLLGLLDQLEFQPDGDLALQILTGSGVSITETRAKVEGYVPAEHDGLSWMVCRYEGATKMRGGGKWEYVLSLQAEPPLRRLLMRAATVTFDADRSAVELRDVLYAFSELPDGAQLLLHADVSIPARQEPAVISDRDWTQITTDPQTLSAVIDAARRAQQRDHETVTVDDLLMSLSHDHTASLAAQGWAITGLRTLDEPPSKDWTSPNSESDHQVLQR
jgi:ATP-dependent Clp protease ATP-binding subunit ClpA